MRKVEKVSKTNLKLNLKEKHKMPIKENISKKVQPNFASILETELQKIK